MKLSIYIEIVITKIFFNYLAFQLFDFERTR
jgi:hypothetical protein